MQAEPDSTVGRAATLRETGNQLFKDQQYGDAVSTYREALSLLQSADEGSQGQGPELGQALRLNLATGLLRLEGAAPHEEAVALCNCALEVDAESAKALFLRGSAQRNLAEVASCLPSEQKDLLQAARRDLLQAARLKPQDRQVRQSLDEVTEALKKLTPARGSGLAGAFLDQQRGLYDDQREAPAPAEPVVCSVCGFEGHACCGRSEWLRRRARWLDTDEAEVGRDPPGYEDDGTLIPLRKAQRPSSEVDGDISDMSEDEREMLEDCLDSTEKPYPQIMRKLGLRQAVHCAEQLWAEED